MSIPAKKIKKLVGVLLLGVVGVVPGDLLGLDFRGQPPTRTIGKNVTKIGHLWNKLRQKFN